jgi:Zn-dependent M28 family amino/carboxypeptidase
VLVVVSEPPSQDERFFKGAALTYYGRWTYKFEEAARRGAVGALVIHRTDLASYGWQVVRNSGASEKSYMTADPLNTLRAASWIHNDAAQRLFAAAGMAGVDAEIDAAGRRGFRAVELPLRLKGHIASAVRSYRSDNVIGMIPGTLPGPGRRRQAVLYTAHYDHLGIDPSIKGDGIFNGAADNATGCAILLELARAFAAAPPPHDVYFAAVTAEEQGLLGSGYLGEHPPLPAEDITLDLNFDELLPVGIPASVDVTGAERTSFFPAVRSTARAFGMAIQPDPEPGAGLYYRSDHFSLARVGIPAFSIGEGTLFEGHPPAWGMEQREDYTAHRYHQPGDEYRPDMDFRGDARMARFGFVLGWLASSAPGRIEWLAGDEFEKARKKAQP